MSEITIDDLSHENSLIRARNERLEVEKVEILHALEFLAHRVAIDQYPNLKNWPALDRAIAVINKHTGSAT